MKQVFFRLRLFVSMVAVLGVLVVATPTTSAATTLLSDSFGTGSSVNDIPDWDEEGDDSDASTRAKSFESSGNDSISPDGGRFAKIAEDEWICREVSAVGYDTLQISYHWRGDSDAEGSDDGIVEYKAGSGSCSGGDWTELEDHNLSSDSSWTTQGAFDLPDALDNTIFRLRFRTDSSSDDEYFRVDGVQIAGEVIVVVTPTPEPSESPTPTPTPEVEIRRLPGQIVVRGTAVDTTTPITAFQFSIGGTVDAFSATGETVFTRPRGTYEVNGVAVEGYTISYGGDCVPAGVVALGSGETRICAITFTGSEPGQTPPATTPTPTTAPTPSESPAPTSSPTPTPEVTPTPSESPSPSESPEPIPTPSESPTPSPTPSESPTPTPSETPTPTPEVTPTPSVSIAPEVTPTPESTPAPTATPVITQTPAPTPEPTLTLEVTPTPDENQEANISGVVGGNIFSKFWNWLTNIF